MIEISKKKEYVKLVGSPFTIVEELCNGINAVMTAVSDNTPEDLERYFELIIATAALAAMHVGLDFDKLSVDRIEEVLDSVIIKHKDEDKEDD